MSSDLFEFDDSFFSDPFSPFADSPIDILHSVLQNPVDDQISPPPIFSTSPPSHQLQNLSLRQNLQNVSDCSNRFADLSTLEVKTEDCRVPYGCDSFGPRSYGEISAENVAEMMQRSFSSGSFDGKPGFLFRPRFDSVVESPNFQPHVSSSPENRFSTGQMRRVFSTGDLQKIKTTQGNHMLLSSSSSPLAREGSFMEETNFKMGRYSAEERKERIHRYRAKRTQRNFNKTIKYACRKTLADNRPRIRGRFARNDETGEVPKAANYNRYEDEDDLWVDGFRGDDEERTVIRKGPIFNILGPTQVQYYGY